MICLLLAAVLLVAQVTVPSTRDTCRCCLQNLSTWATAQLNIHVHRQHTGLDQQPLPSLMSLCQAPALITVETCLTHPDGL